MPDLSLQQSQKKKEPLVQKFLKRECSLHLGYDIYLNAFHNTLIVNM